MGIVTVEQINKVTGKVTFHLDDIEIVETYRLNDLGFWTRYTGATGTGIGQFFTTTEEYLVIVQDALTEWNPAPYNKETSEVPLNEVS